MCLVATEGVWKRGVERGVAVCDALLTYMMIVRQRPRHDAIVDEKGSAPALFTPGTEI